MRSDSNDRKISRRRAVQTLGIVGSAGIAGCLGGGDEDTDDTGDTGDDGDSDDSDDTGGSGGSDDLGERVPTVSVVYFGAYGQITQAQEEMLPIFEDNMDALGVGLDITPKEVTRVIEDTGNDVRNDHVIFYSHGPSPDRLDPEEMIRRFGIDYAGSNNRLNTPNWASCEFTKAAVEQSSAPTEEDRRVKIQEAIQIMSEDKAIIPIFPFVNAGAARTDQIDMQGDEALGVTRSNPLVYIHSTPTDGDQLLTNTPPVTLETVNYLASNDNPGLTVWNNLPQSPLANYDRNLELQMLLMEDYTVEDEGTTITVNLRDGTFHNGDPITSEDVQFTYNILQEHSETFLNVTPIPIDTIDTPDDKTAVFNLNEPYYALITREFPKWGIMHKESFVEAGIREDPEGYEPDPFIGSGPFQVDTFQAGEFMELTPHDGHPVYDLDHSVAFSSYRDESSAVESLIAGEINILGEASIGGLDRVEDQIPDENETSVVTTHTPYPIYPQCNWGPTKFPEFRDAIGTAINRQLMNEVAMASNSEPELYSTVLMEKHPFRPPNENLYKFTDDPAGDTDAARQKLEDAGWNWDDNGNLHYPADADLSPLWPEGETPQPEDFPCINEDGEYTG